MNTLRRKPRQLMNLVFILIAILGVILLADFLRNRSEINNQFLFGFSLKRLVTAVFFGSLLALNLGAIIWLNTKLGNRQLIIENRLVTWLESHLFLVFTTLCFSALASGTLLLIIIPPVIRMFGFFEQVWVQMGGLVFWFFLACTSLAVLFRMFFWESLQNNKGIAFINRFLLITVVFLTVFFLYEHLLIWMEGANQSRYSYWNLLADEFLQGRLYLPHPPQTHDLTLYNGKWYVPMPPAPAVLMMPLAFLFGGENINTSDFSIMLSAINAVLVFLILEQLVNQKWIRLSRTGIFLLVILFIFGTPHLWVGIRGRSWFVSQIVTVTFLALAVFATLKSASPWLIGTFIGVAVMSRPNGILSWPFVLAIAMQILKEKHGSINLRQIFDWSIKSALPTGAAVIGLLFYNYARFNNFFDFGYITISGAEDIVANVQKYGMFHPHFIIPNLKAMLIYVPDIRPESRWLITPSTTGTSIFLVTPPLIYLFRRYERKWWVVGAWVSIFLNFALLILYHNTGAHQFGYRYILDAMVPIITMLAVALDGKIPWHFIVLLIFSILFNIYGAYWFIQG